MPRRILLFITDLEIGGTPTVVRELAARLHDPPHVEIEVACLKAWGPVADQIREVGVNVTALGATSRFQFGRAAWQLRDLVRERAIDTVFSFLVHANAVAAKASRELTGVRFIQSIQTTQPRPWWHWWVQKKVASAAEKVVVPSPSAADVAHDWAGVPRDKIVVIPNAVDVAAFSRVAAERETFLGQHHAVDSAVRIGFLGRLDPVKRVEDLICAMRYLSDGGQLNRYQLHVFGDGAERAKLEALAAKEVPQQTEVVFHGSVSTPGEALKQIDLLVLPSKAEGFGLVLIEAMAAGVPVVATNVAGIRDVVAHERTGLLVPAKSPKKLAAAIQRIAQDRDLSRRLVLAGLSEVREKYNWNTVTQQYRELLKITSAVNQTPPAPLPSAASSIAGAPTGIAPDRP